MIKLGKKYLFPGTLNALTPCWWFYFNMAVNIELEIIPKCNLIPSEAYCFLLLFLKYTWTTFEKESRDQNWKKNTPNGWGRKFFRGRTLHFYPAEHILDEELDEEFEEAL